MTMNKILLVLIVASGFLLIFYANNDIFTRKRWASLFQSDQDEQQQQQQPPAHDDNGAELSENDIQSASASVQLPHGGTLLQQQQQQRSLHQPAHGSQHGERHRAHHQPAAALAADVTNDGLRPVRYVPSANNSAAAAEHNIFVIYTKENYMLRTKFEMFVKSLLKYATVPLHLHIISDARSNASAEEIVRQQLVFYKRRAVRVQYSLYNVTEAAGRIVDITRAMMPYFSVPGSQYSDALFYVSLGLHRIADPGMRRAILIDCDVVFRSDVSRLFEEFNRFSSDNLFGLSPELTPVYYHVLYKYRGRNPATSFGKPYYPAGSVESRPAHGGRGTAVAANAKQRIKHGYPGLNSGVVMLNLERIRRSKLFEDVLRPEHVERLVHKYQFRGHLGDQDYYTLLGYDVPGLIYRLDCVWNRQLCTWWKDHGYSEIFDTFFHCEGKIRLYHGNCNTRVPE